MRRRSLVSLLILAYAVDSAAASDKIDITETDDAIHIDTPDLEATISKKGYVTGVKAQSFRDKRTGFRDAGFGLDIVDWTMEPGSDEAYRDRLDRELIYRFGNEYHGDTPKRSIEGPQICTQAKELHPEVIRGEDFVAVKQQFRYRTAAPGRKTARPGRSGSYSPRESDTSSRWTASMPSTAATRCSCGSTCPATSSTIAGTHSRRST